MSFYGLLTSRGRSYRYGDAGKAWTMSDPSTDFRVWAMGTDIVEDKVEIVVADIYAVLA